MWVLNLFLIKLLFLEVCSSPLLLGVLGPLNGCKYSLGLVHTHIYYSEIENKKNLDEKNNPPPLTWPEASFLLITSLYQSDQLIGNRWFLEESRNIKVFLCSPKRSYDGTEKEEDLLAEGMEVVELEAIKKELILSQARLKLTQMAGTTQVNICVVPDADFEAWFRIIG